MGLFVYSTLTFNIYQSLSVEEDSSQLNNNEELDNDFFNSLSRTLPNIDEDPLDENEELYNEGGVIFDNFNTEESINEEDGSSKKTESNEQESRDILTESLNNGFSDGSQEAERLLVIKVVVAII